MSTQAADIGVWSISNIDFVIHYILKGFNFEIEKKPKIRVMNQFILLTIYNFHHSTQSSLEPIIRFFMHFSFLLVTNKHKNLFVLDIRVAKMMSRFYFRGCFKDKYKLLKKVTYEITKYFYCHWNTERETKLLKANVLWSLSFLSNYLLNQKGTKRRFFFWNCNKLMSLNKIWLTLTEMKKWT